MITHEMQALAATVANVNGLMPDAGPVAAVLLAVRFNLKPLALHNESRMEMHEQSAQTLEPWTAQGTRQEAAFLSLESCYQYFVPVPYYSVHTCTLVPYRYSGTSALYSAPPAAANAPATLGRNPRNLGPLRTAAPS